MENVEVQVITTRAGGAVASFDTTADMLFISGRLTTLAAYTLTYPANPRPFQSFGVSCRHAITTITSQASGREIHMPLTSLPANGGFAWWTYIPSENYWARTG